jgi:hypothetical protein
VIFNYPIPPLDHNMKRNSTTGVNGKAFTLEYTEYTENQKGIERDCPRTGHVLLALSDF